MKIKAILIFTICAALISGCQQTPEGSTVSGKNNDTMEEIIKAERGSAVTTIVEDSDAHWDYTKTYREGKSLTADADIYPTDIDSVAVISIAPNTYDSGEALEQIAQALLPNGDFRDRASEFSKEEIESIITEYKEEIFLLENKMSTSGDLTKKRINDDPEEEIAMIGSEIERLESIYDSAPSDADLPLASYSFSGRYSRMMAVDGKTRMNFDFVNWDDGSGFYMESSEYSSIENDISSFFITPAGQVESSGLRAAREAADIYVKSMGIDYMTCDLESFGENTYTFYYTRAYNGLNETYANRYVGTTVSGVDGSAVVMNLWGPEYLQIRLQDGEIVKLTWENRSKLTEIDNKSVSIISLDEAKEIFLKQMEYMLTYKFDETNISASNYLIVEDCDIVITQVKLGYTKLLMQDSKDDYKLIPTWSFMGYDTLRVDEGNIVGAETAYLTVNALDGTIVDRGLMY